MDRSGLGGRRVAVGIGGGIAAYKACELVRTLRRAGAEVRVAMTPAAQAFVTPLTLQSLSGHPVLTEPFDAASEAGFGHLALARWAELFVVAPATADLLARIRAGMANDAVTTPLLAFRGPVLLAPAMNVAMWENSVTRENVAALAAQDRFRVVGPASGRLADGDTGPGRLAEVEDIVDGCAEVLSQGPLTGRRVLVTAGPTREFLDPVRFISNPSTGKMGVAMARAARRRGAEVAVVLGPGVELETEGLEAVRVVTAAEMRDAVLGRVSAVDFFVAAAAVSDWRPAERAAQKRKKGEGPQAESLRLERTPDVLAEAAEAVRSAARRPVLVGFAAETERLLEHASAKLLRKGLDVIVANDVTRPGAGFAGDTNAVTVLSRSGERLELSGTKAEVAERLWDLLLEAFPRPARASR
ncbi:MAG TPA: bifunctional phosphopantothenoylcysteine decarboxylase/phosphopantothenate--cysteine ligase CoaBC [Myxococcaceae bacterium]|nr:bifunctional phosphopantothenoylcysteine decarboxylase/phosphopantothenate--cysteine ligase CoaBC [Myxococcaceae bacterium]